jgi:hypothetical protein
MFRWGEDLIVATPHGIELYMMPIDREPPLNFQTLPFERFAWEITIYDKSNISPLYEELFPTHTRSVDSDAALFILMFAKAGPIFTQCLCNLPLPRYHTSCVWLDSTT